MSQNLLPTQPQPATSWKGAKSPPSRISLAPAGLRVELRPPAPAPKTSRPTWPWRQVLMLGVLLTFAAGSYLGVSRYVITAVVIQGRSMSPTLHDGEHCYMDRWTLKHRDPTRGDLIVLQDPGHEDYAVKRIVGIPGETIAIRNGEVFVNGERLAEGYLPNGLPTYTPNRREQLIMLGQTHYFVLGDNRAISEDSRSYGPITRQAIVGLITR